jgi:hypothetical protein
MPSDDSCSRFEVPDHVDDGPDEKVICQGREGGQKLGPTQDDKVKELLRDESYIRDHPVSVNEAEGRVAKVDRGDDSLCRESQHFEGRVYRVNVAFGMVEEVGELVEERSASLATFQGRLAS